MFQLMVRFLAAVLLVVGMADMCLASGYAIYEWGARGNGMGGTLVGRADDPSAVPANPAGITQLEGTHFQVGATAVAPSADIDLNGGGGEAGDLSGSIWALPSMYYTRQMSDHYWVGLGMYSRVGLGTEYADQDHWAGRYNCSYAALREVSFNPNLAMKLTDELSLAVGAEVAYLQFDYSSYIDPTGAKDPGTTATDIKQELVTDGFGYGFNLALHYKPLDWLALGASWRSEIQLTVNGDVDFSQKGVIDPAAVGLTDTSVHGTEPLPESLALGVVVYPMDRLSIEVDAIWTKWSAYKTLVINYDDPLFGVLDAAESDKNWKDTWRFQVGLEYNLTEMIDLRCGYVYDQSPINDSYEDYSVPGNDRQIATLGVGFHRGNWTVDGSYGYLWMKDRHYDTRLADGIVDSDMEGGVAHMVGVSVGYKF